MPATGKVSVGWQIVFALIPFLDLWAFYRIRKLRKYLLFTAVPTFISAFVQSLYFGDLDTSYDAGVLTYVLPTIDFSYTGFI